MKDNHTFWNLHLKANLTITLLTDSDFKVSKKYNVHGDKSFLGKHYKGITRTTFILDKNKKILKKYDKVKFLGHAKEVLDFIKSQKIQSLI